MKRSAIKLVVFLLLGAIVNVAVAWGLAYQLDVIKFGEEQGGITGSPLNWAGMSWQSVGACRIHSTWMTTCGFPFDGTIHPLAHALIPDWSPLPQSPPERLIDTDFRVHALQSDLFDVRGWPALALCSWMQWTELGEEQIAGIIVRREQSPLMNVMMPTKPIWPGFAINTIFYAAMLWVMFAFPFVVRRRRRIKRGQCPACAYPVGTSPVCTECGGSLPSPSRK